MDLIKIYKGFLTDMNVSSKSSALSLRRIALRWVLLFKIHLLVFFCFAIHTLIFRTCLYQCKHDTRISFLLSTYGFLERITYFSSRDRGVWMGFLDVFMFIYIQTSKVLTIIIVLQLNFFRKKSEKLKFAFLPV